MILFIVLAFASPNQQKNILHAIQMDAQKVTDIGSILFSEPQEQRIPELFYHIEKINKNIVRLEELYKNRK